MDEVDKMIKQMNDHSPTVRSNTAWELGNRGDVRSVPILSEALFDAEWHVRENAADALGKIKDPEAIPALLKLLKGKDSCDRNWASDALSSIGLDHLKIDDRVLCLLFTHKMVQIGHLGKKAAPQLINSLGHSEGFIRRRAYHGIETILKYPGIDDKDFQLQLQDGYDRLTKKCIREEYLIDIKLQFAKLRILNANRVNEHSKDKGILLDDKPKPPKKGSLYQQLRRQTYG